MVQGISSLIQGEIFDPIRHILRVQHRADYFEIQHLLPNGRRELMSINEPRKEHSLGLARLGNRQQIVILTEQYAPQGSRTIKQRDIFQPCGPVFLRCYRINPSPPPAVMAAFTCTSM
jgi:hypothetical protein